MTASQPPKPRVAFFDFTSCEGCQLTVVDSLETHPELLDAVDIVEFREAITEVAETYDVAFIEGSCTRESDEQRLRAIRAKAKFVVALGSCAHLGGINAIKNRMPPNDVHVAVYGRDAKAFDTYATRPISAVIPIECTIPGCPINAQEFLQLVTFLMQGRTPDLIDYPVCIECKLAETACVYLLGRTCLGPITRAGCAAICPSNGYQCVGCRGLTSNANLASLRQVMAEHGLTPSDVENSLSMFLTWQLSQRHDEEKHRA